MYWRITCYNGTVWEPPTQMGLITAVELFKHESGLSDFDIKTIESKH